jgi:hypothetical protein
MKIESSDQDIRTLLSSAYYRIPRFQRPYSWDQENIQDFWNDVVRDTPTDYFIGSMVVYKDQINTYGVVDGQQRLTTITILLCVLRNALSENGFDDLAQGIHGLIERKNIDNKPQYILSTESSYPFFQDRIQKFGKPEIEVQALREEETLQSAYEQLQATVDGVIKSVHADPTLSQAKHTEIIRQKMVAIRDALLGLKLIFIKLDDEDDAYLIFETLNTRGKDLNLSDLVKNHLTKHLKAANALVDETKIKWEQVLDTIEGSSADLNMDTFTHHYWLSKYDYQTQKELFKVLKKQITKIEAGKFLDSLVSDSVLYRSIHEPTYGKWTKQESRIRGALEALQLFRVQQQTPCVLSLAREYASEKLKKKHLEDALVAIEKFHFLFTAVTSQRSSGGISGMYASLGRRLFEAADTHEAVEIIQELKTKLRDRVPSLEEVVALIPEMIYTSNITKLRKLVKYALVGFAKHHEGGVVVDYETMTIEHLVPQSLIGTNGYNDAIIGQVGNLVLVSEELNHKLKDKTFKDKKNILEAAGYQLPEDVKQAIDWTDAEIVKRTKKLAEQAYNTVWRI